MTKLESLKSVRDLFCECSPHYFCWWRDIARRIDWWPNQRPSSLLYTTRQWAENLLTATLFYSLICGYFVSLCGLFLFQSCPDFLVTQGADLGLICDYFWVVKVARTAVQNSNSLGRITVKTVSKFRQNSGLFGGCFWRLFKGCSGVGFEAETQQKQQG